MIWDIIFQVVKIPEDMLVLLLQLAFCAQLNVAHLSSSQQEEEEEEKPTYVHGGI